VPEGKDMNVKTILVPLDGSSLSELALAPAIDLAREKGARLVLLRAAEAHTTIADPTEAQVEVVREAEEYLGRVRARVLAGGLEGVETSVWYGPPDEAIVEAARYRGADLIVMSSHGRNGLGRLVLGSVAESVLRATPTPILLIRAGGAPLDVPFCTRPAARELSHV
jgi:nucleotide-binding universal stress UspA family protein